VLRHRIVTPGAKIPACRIPRARPRRRRSTSRRTSGRVPTWYTSQPVSSGGGAGLRTPASEAGHCPIRRGVKAAPRILVPKVQVRILAAGRSVPAGLPRVLGGDRTETAERPLRGARRGRALCDRALFVRGCEPLREEATDV